MPPQKEKKNNLNKSTIEDISSPGNCHISQESKELHGGKIPEMPRTNSTPGINQKLSISQYFTRKIFLSFRYLIAALFPDASL